MMTGFYPRNMCAKLFALAIALIPLSVFASIAAADIEALKSAWPRTDFSKTTVDLAEIFSGGIPRDHIPAIDQPTIGTLAQGADAYDPREPVITVAVNGQIRGYPLTILVWHEIVNDRLGDVPITVTYCPLCSSAVVFDRRVGDRVLDFGVSGNLRFSDLVMYDRQTESWWQQFTGTGIVGEYAGTELAILPVRVEPFGVFAARNPNADVLLRPPGFPRNYGVNPYAGYDTGDSPLFPGIPEPEGIAPLAYVVAVENQAWSLELLKRKKRIETDDLVLTWQTGQLSVLDIAYIKEGRDIGYVTVQRKQDGGLVEVLHDMTFAFAFNAFRPDGTIHQ
ncbi:MAG: DUF3179 domain-containing protein [Alphaproteobacteria bacterium]|nr:DUF3179 domain-containing protein [Alphaproteobacteria bacterium]MCZ6592024.1 DUF3179 domain-containing protein [Alphaproteobacteria bacterium]